MGPRCSRPRIRPNSEPITRDNARTPRRQNAGDSNDINFPIRVRRPQDDYQYNHLTNARLQASSIEHREEITRPFVKGAPNKTIFDIPGNEQLAVVAVPTATSKSSESIETDAEEPPKGPSRQRWPKLLSCCRPKMWPFRDYRRRQGNGETLDSNAFSDAQLTNDSSRLIAKS